MDIGLAALLLLFFTVLVGFVRKLNVGLLAIAGAVILGYGTGLFKGSKIIAGFSASLFMILLGITLFFGIIQSNGCIELSMRKLVGLFGRQCVAGPAAGLWGGIRVCGYRSWLCARYGFCSSRSCPPGP